MAEKTTNITPHDILLSLVKQKRLETLGIYAQMLFITILFIVSYFINLGFTLSAYIATMMISATTLTVTNIIFNAILFIAAQTAVQSATIEKKIELVTASIIATAQKEKKEKE